MASLHTLWLAFVNLLPTSSRSRTWHPAEVDSVDSSRFVQVLVGLVCARIAQAAPLSSDLLRRKLRTQFLLKTRNATRNVGVLMFSSE